MSTVQVLPKPDLKELEKSFAELKEAHAEQAIHLRRYEDMKPILDGARETVRSQESVINNLEEMIKTNLHSHDKINNKQVEYKVGVLRAEREYLEQKRNQLMVMMDMNGGVISKEDLRKLKKEKMFEADSKLVESLKFKANALMTEIERLSGDLEDANIFGRVQNSIKYYNIHDIDSDIKAKELRKKIARENETAESLELQVLYNMT